MIPKHIHTASDLVTSSEAICDGFLRQAIKKVEQASPYVKQALRFREALLKAKTPANAMRLHGFTSDLVASAGFSEKSQVYFSAQQLEKAVEKVLQTIYEKNPEGFCDDVFCRYLLTKGDSLGGKMRNITGASGSGQFTEAVTGALTARKLQFHATVNNTHKIQSIVWDNRCLVFDRSPKIIGNNVDAILLDTQKVPSVQILLETPSTYLACGELKSGIDPAGADEHWKTARSALDRIRAKLGNHCPPLFFVGAAIENAMATEIFGRLQNGTLAHSANLTSQQQLSDLTGWLVSL